MNINHISVSRVQQTVPDTKDCKQHQLTQTRFCVVVNNTTQPVKIINLFFSLVTKVHYVVMHKWNILYVFIAN